MKPITITFSITVRRLVIVLIAVAAVFIALSLPALIKPRNDFSWIKAVPVNPSEFIYDLETVALNQVDFDAIAPRRVWRDKTFTYIDFEDKYMPVRPVVSILIWGTGESPASFRTDGENSRLIIVDGLGDFVLRSGPHKVYIVAPDEISSAHWKQAHKLMQNGKLLFECIKSGNQPANRGLHSRRPSPRLLLMPKEYSYVN
jgi:hypothetical protein